jgi:hypothetical protein
MGDTIMQKLVNGQLVDLTQEEITQRLLDEEAWLNKSKPILSGDVLGKKIRSLFKGQTIKERARILKPVLTELSILEKDDEITQLEYNEFKTELILGIGDNLTTEQISQIEQILDDFVLAYRL